jgi:hypothetical protein
MLFGGPYELLLPKQKSPCALWGVGFIVFEKPNFQTTKNARKGALKYFGESLIFIIKWVMAA